jgi:hypothetical protein
MSDLRRCRTPGVDPDVWFAGDDSPKTEYARQFCQACPLVTECRDYARSEGIPAGVWGAETAKERNEWWDANGGRPDHFRQVIDGYTLALLQERRDHENFDTQHPLERVS